VFVIFAMELSSAVQSAVWKRAVGSLVNFSIKQRAGTFVLDPLSVIVVLAMNASKPVGTKLYIGNGFLELHDSSPLQGTVRAWVGENKMNIKLINHPIIFACKHFLQSKHQYLENSDNYTYDDIRFLFEQAKIGLTNLKHTYRKDRELHACVNTYINIITAATEMKSESTEILNMLIMLKLSDIASLPSSNVPNNNPDVTVGGAAHVKSNLYDELHRSWDINKIRTVIGMLKELSTATPFSKKHIFVAIDAFMMCIHEKTKNTSETVFEVH